ncbi:hypothetical protein [Mesorhizobium sp. M8A.F.Ca.ET.021.01.1.1]|uniref:hypothetical protein n=1 Tax=Mesorhizobium sp. M8A.F.Ca.ET.021.01.1.1 TaxID=2496757 RepID=UPI000FCA9681|nr:hypothetical protein [Mesorhizobium sp. M8A.F.Ca.ET.021.01.1.1]RUW56739.1 hypothetical protein EOA36_02830 [Mesorhizobium sp. M8A.F.Ca.ET.021.01.1.1]
MYTSNIDAIIAKMQGIEDRIKKHFAKVVSRVVLEIDTSIHPRTPVWSGRAVRNMIWTKGTPNAVEHDPIGGGEEGPGRRGANSAAAHATREALDFSNPFAVYWLTNNARHIEELEAGLLPYPGKHPVDGMFGITYAEVVAKLGNM